MAAAFVLWMTLQSTNAFIMEELTNDRSDPPVLRRVFPPTLPPGLFAPSFPEGACGAFPSIGQAEGNTLPLPSSDFEQNQAADLSPPALSGSDLTRETPAKSPLEKGRQYQAQLSHYGYAHDPYMDSYTKKGLGNSNNQLQTGVVAIDPESRSRYGVKNGDIVSFTLEDGTQYAGYVGDTTAKGLGPRFDIYDPSGNLIVRDDGRKGTVTIEARAPEAYKGPRLDIEGPALLRQFLESQNLARQGR